MVPLVNVAMPALAIPPPPFAAQLALRMQLVNVAVPALRRPPPTYGKVTALPPVIVISEIDAVTRASTWNTRLTPPRTVTPAAGPAIEVAPVVSLNSSWPPFRVIVRG